MRYGLNRREFLRTTAISAASLGAETLHSAESANERLHVGVIGVAGQGAYDLREVAKAGAAIVALCDADENRAHGRDERVGVREFDESVEYTYRLIRAMSRVR